jgi:hypothetical protein
VSIPDLIFPVYKIHCEQSWKKCFQGTFEDIKEVFRFFSL